MMTLAAIELHDESFAVYMNMRHGIWMKYPSDWQKIEDQGDVAFMVAFISPLEDPFDQFRENLSICVEQFPGIPFEQVVAYKYQAGQVTFLEKAIQDKIGGLPAYRTLWTGAILGRSIKWLQYLASRRDSVYSITYTAEFCKYELFLSTIQLMIASLQIK